MSSCRTMFLLHLQSIRAPNAQCATLPFPTRAWAHVSLCLASTQTCVWPAHSMYSTCLRMPSQHLDAGAHTAVSGWSLSTRLLATEAHEATHTGDEPFKCTKCGRRFSQPQYLKTHVTTHTGDEPFKCTKCNRSFSQPQNLKPTLLLLYIVT